jgi:prepilin-type N-terminal cleavage/methylation domain-containing protein
MRTAFRRLGPQAGFSLIEMMIAVSVMGLLLAIAMPKVRETLIAREVKSARAAVANTYARARVTALQSRKETTVHFSASYVWITVPGAGKQDTLGAPTNLANAYGVTVTSSVPTVRFYPTGLAMNLAAPATVKVTRANKSDSVTISGYGRLQ